MAHDDDIQVLTGEEIALETGDDCAFLLDVRESVWIVQSGRIDVFLVEMQGGEPVGIRRHLFRVQAGNPVFGIGRSSRKEKMGLLAVGTGETTLLKLRRSGFRTLAPGSPQAEAVSRLLEDWIDVLSAGIAQDVMPKKYEELEAGEEQLFAPETDVRSAGRVLWVRHLEGTSLLMGNGELPSLNGSGLFPLPRRIWLQTTEVARLAAAETSDLVDREAVWDGLEWFHTMFMEQALRAAREAAQTEQKRLARRAQHYRHVLDEAVDRLAAVLEVEGDGPQLSSHAEDPLLAACRLVGERQGLAIEQATRREEDGVRQDPLGRIARASGIRVRKVALRGEWWTQDNGPLLGLIEEGRRPVALLPTSARGYELRDPTTGIRKPVDEAVAESLQPFARAFYRPFPRQAVTLKEVLGFGTKECRKDLLTVLLMGAAGGALSMIVPLATGLLFNDIIPGAERGQLSQLTLALLVVAVVATLFQFTRSIALLRIQGKMAASVQSALWDRLLNLPLSFFRSYTAGDLAKRAMGLSAIQRLLAGPTITALLGGVFSVFNFGLLFYYSVELALWAAFLVGIALTVTLAGNYVQLRYQRTIADLGTEISGLVLQLLTGLPKLRVAGAEAKAFAIWTRMFSKKRRMQFKKRRVQNGLMAFHAAFPVLIILVIFALAVPRMAQEQVMQTGDFLAFVAALTAFLTAILSASGASTRVLNTIPLYENAQPILETLPEVDAAKADPGLLRGAVEVQHVSFRYDADGPLVLRDVSMQIEPGEMVAFVGPSGSGKSTVLRLLLGFETPEAGSIYYDGQDLAGLDLQAVRRQIGVVLQDGKLIPGDLFTNIVGSSMASLDDAWEAAHMAGFAGDIEQMPMGMHTVISEGGSTLSGGQRQRLMIARAIVNRPRVLFFDEATSALDNKTQAIISRSLERLEATRIVVAHRLSTIMNADRIYVLEAGRLVQCGSYEELMRQDGLFAALAERQLA